jgi:hypothetical protein
MWELSYLFVAAPFQEIMSPMMNNTSPYGLYHSILKDHQAVPAEEQHPTEQLSRHLSATGWSSQRSDTAEPGLSQFALVHLQIVMWYVLHFFLKVFESTNFQMSLTSSFHFKHSSSATAAPVTTEHTILVFSLPLYHRRSSAQPAVTSSHNFFNFWVLIKWVLPPFFFIVVIDFLIMFDC